MVFCMIRTALKAEIDPGDREIVKMTKWVMKRIAGERLALLQPRGNMKSCLLFVFVVFLVTGNCEIVRTSLGNQIRMILKHYQQTNPVGLPGDFVPDPKAIPDIAQTILVNEIRLTDMNVYGLSKFRIIELRTDLVDMQTAITIAMTRLIIRGLYEQCVWYCTGRRNNFTIDLSNIKIFGLAKLQVAVDGKLYADDVDMDLDIDTIDKHFDNLEGLGSLIETFIDGTFIFDMMKPMILNEVNTNIRGEVNRKLSRLPNDFPNSASPLDISIIEARQEVRKLGYDPLKLANQLHDLGLFTVSWQNTSVIGLSNFHRHGNMTITMKNNTLFADVTVTTREIRVFSEWTLSTIGGFSWKTGDISFDIEYLRANVRISQPLDVRNQLCLEKVDMELGNIQMIVHNAGTLGYVIEAAVNIFPNLLRDQIMNAVEAPLKIYLQSELEKINVEELIESNIPEIEKHAKKFETILGDGESEGDNRI